MARPTKQGIDYFPLDTQFDDKVELFIVENGPVSLSVLVTVWQLIYQNEGYFIEYSQDLFILIKRRLLLEVSDIEKIIQAAIRRGLFCNTMFSKHKILTSKAIQKRFFIASKKKKTVSVNKNYLCSGVSDVGNDNVMWVSDGKNATKEKEKGKEEEKGNKKDKYGTFFNVFLTSTEKAKLDEKFGVDVDARIEALSEYMKSKGKKYDSHYATILSWKRRDDKSQTPVGRAGIVNPEDGYAGSGKRLTI